MLLYLKKISNKTINFMKSFLQTYIKFIFLLKVQVAVRMADQVQMRSRCLFFESLSIYLSDPINPHSAIVLISDIFTRV